MNSISEGFLSRIEFAIFANHQSIRKILVTELFPGSLLIAPIYEDKRYVIINKYNWEEIRYFITKMGIPSDSKDKPKVLTLYGVIVEENEELVKKIMLNILDSV